MSVPACFSRVCVCVCVSGFAWFLFLMETTPEIRTSFSTEFAADSFFEELMKVADTVLDLEEIDEKCRYRSQFLEK